MPHRARELTRAIAAGDEAAFEHFYRTWFDAMYVEAHRLTGRDEAECLDVVHDAMLRVIRSMKPLDDEAQLHAWLRKVVRSCAIDRLRREARRLRRERRHGVPTATVTIDDRLEWIHAQLARLDEDTGLLLALRHRFGLTLQQIGDVTGLRPGAVDGRLRRAAAQLRARAGEVDDG